MANASGSQCVNLHKKKHSFLVLQDSAGRFNGTTLVTAVKDVKPGNNVADFDFDKKPKGNSNRVAIKIKGNGTQAIKGNGTKAAFSGIMPLDGTLQVTLTSTPAIIVDDIPVIYCDDDEVPIP